MTIVTARHLIQSFLARQLVDSYVPASSAQRSPNWRADACPSISFAVTASKNHNILDATSHISCWLILALKADSSLTNCKHSTTFPNRNRSRRKSQTTLGRPECSLCFEHSPVRSSIPNAHSPPFPFSLGYTSPENMHALNQTPSLNCRLYCFARVDNGSAPIHTVGIWTVGGRTLNSKIASGRRICKIICC